MQGPTFCVGGYRAKTVGIAPDNAILRRQSQAHLTPTHAPFCNQLNRFLASPRPLFEAIFTIFCGNLHHFSWQSTPFFGVISTAF